MAKLDRMGEKSAENLIRAIENSKANDLSRHWVQQQYLPDALKGVHYYEYGDNKTEQAAKHYWDEIKGPQP